MNSFPKIAVFWFFTGCLTILDQLTKAAAKQALGAGYVKSVLPGIFELCYVENRGAAFGMLQDRQWIFILFALIVLAGSTAIYPRILKGKRYHILRICICLLTAGAFGNMIDRILRGYVIDFFYFSVVDFPVFNVADVYVCVSCAVLFLSMLTLYRNEEVLET